MKPLGAIEPLIAAAGERTAQPARAAGDLLSLAEVVLGHWLAARGETAGRAEREGFRLLALQRQGAKGDPSFNACRETCREIAYHYNLITMQPDHPQTPQRLRMMAMVATHLHLFVSGKLQVAGLGDFCCSSRSAHVAGA